MAPCECIRCWVYERTALALDAFKKYLASATLVEFSACPASLSLLLLGLLIYLLLMSTIQEMYRERQR